ncbi:MAG: hypothetical protein ABGX16_21860 [Pirellulales bacterium]
MGKNDSRPFSLGLQVGVRREAVGRGIDRHYLRQWRCNFLYDSRRGGNPMDDHAISIRAADCGNSTGSRRSSANFATLVHRYAAWSSMAEIV